MQGHRRLVILDTNPARLETAGLVNQTQAQMVQLGMAGFTEPERVGPVKLLVLQGTAFCNIDCSYCYLPDRDNTARMSVETVAAVVKRLQDDRLLRGPLLVNWHAGEPLVLPPSFYEERLPLFAPLATDGIPVTHSLQTNGMLVTPEHCELFLTNPQKCGWQGK